LYLVFARRLLGRIARLGAMERSATIAASAGLCGELRRRSPTGWHGTNTIVNPAVVF
jgi:hypothetical protein